MKTTSKSQQKRARFRALVVGSEGFGISKLVLKNSDFIVKIPMTGHVNSLNASVASAILISGVVASRSKK